MKPEYDQDEVKKAFDTIKAAMILDEPEEPGSYAHSWHCNIAMMCHDAIKDHDVDALDEYNGKMSYVDALEVGNEAASRFMKLCFGVTTKA